MTENYPFKRKPKLERTYIAVHLIRSYFHLVFSDLSFAFASALVCQCMLLGASAHRHVGYAEFITERHLFAGRSEFSWKIPSSHLELRIAVRPRPEKSGPTSRWGPGNRKGPTFYLCNPRTDPGIAVSMLQFSAGRKSRCNCSWGSLWRSPGGIPRRGKTP
jgi:hypothetical protein